MKNKLYMVGVVLLTLAGFHGVQAVRNGDAGELVKRTIPLLESSVQSASNAATTTGNTIAEIWGKTGTIAHISIVALSFALGLWNLVAGVAMLVGMINCVTEGKSKRMSLRAMLKDSVRSEGVDVADVVGLVCAFPAVVAIGLSTTVFGNVWRLCSLQIISPQENKKSPFLEFDTSTELGFIQPAISRLSEIRSRLSYVQNDNERMKHLNQGTYEEAKKEIAEIVTLLNDIRDHAVKRKESIC